MPIRHRKDRSHLVASGRVPLETSYDGGYATPRYWHLYLWADREALCANAGFEVDPRTAAAFCHAYRVLVLEPGKPDHWKPRRKLGELHLVANEWTVEKVVHEVAHGFFEMLREGCETWPKWTDLATQDGKPPAELRQTRPCDAGMVAEEVACYRMGRLVDAIFSWLWEVNPYGRHAL
jgi:hypothetical protein